jgi:hypothetical protein
VFIALLMIGCWIWQLIMHRRRLIATVMQNFGLDLKQIGLDCDDPAQAPQSQCAARVRRRPRSRRRASCSRFGRTLFGKRRRIYARMGRRGAGIDDDMDPILPIQCWIARTALGWSVRKLALAADVSRDTVVRFERGDGLKAITFSSLTHMMADRARDCRGSGPVGHHRRAPPSKRCSGPTCRHCPPQRAPARCSRLSATPPIHFG